MAKCRRAGGSDEFLDVVRMAGSDDDQLDGPGIGGEIVEERAAHGNRADVKPGIARGPLAQTTTQLCA